MIYVAISKQTTPQGEVLLCTSLKDVSGFTGISWHTLRYQFKKNGAVYYSVPDKYSEVWVTDGVKKQKRPQYKK